MDEFLIPMSYRGGAGLFVCVGFAGLNADNYDQLEIELELTGESIIVERDAENPWMSEGAAFAVAEDDIAYFVKGYVTRSGETRMIEASVPAKRYEAQRLRMATRMAEHGTGALDYENKNDEILEGEMITVENESENTEARYGQL